MLGNIPPRLGGVRVYEKNTHDDEVTKFLSLMITMAVQVVIDLDLMYSGWAPGFPRNLNETDDCVMMAADSGYFWADIR